MAVNAVTSTGITTQTQADLFLILSSALQTIYGNDINLASNSPDGQSVNIFIQVVLDVLDLIVQVFTSMDPDQAFGAVLDSRVAYNGIKRLPATFSIVSINVTATAPVSLVGLDAANSSNPAFTVQDSLGVQWCLITSANIVAGTTSLAFQAVNPGLVQSSLNDITTMVTVVVGVSSVTNPGAPSYLGQPEETDAALKIRRQKAVSQNAQAVVPALEAALQNIPGLSYAKVYENDTGFTDSNGIPRNSIWVIIAGAPNPVSATPWSSTQSYSIGDLVGFGGVAYVSIHNNNLNNPVSNAAFWQVFSPIGNAIYTKRSSGCGIYKEPVSGITYNVTQKDGSLFPVYWSLVTPDPIWITFDAHSINGNSINVANIKSQLVAKFVPGIFETININELATFVQEIDPNVLVTNAGFGSSNIGPFSNIYTPATPNKQATFDVSRMIINIV